MPSRVFLLTSFWMAFATATLSEWEAWQYCTDGGTSTATSESDVDCGGDCRTLFNIQCTFYELLSAVDSATIAPASSLFATCTVHQDCLHYPLRVCKSGKCVTDQAGAPCYAQQECATAKVPSNSSIYANKCANLRATAGVYRNMASTKCVLVSACVDGASGNTAKCGSSECVLHGLTSPENCSNNNNPLPGGHSIYDYDVYCHPGQYVKNASAGSLYTCERCEPGTTTGATTSATSCAITCEPYEYTSVEYNSGAGEAPWTSPCLRCAPGWLGNLTHCADHCALRSDNASACDKWLGGVESGAGDLTEPPCEWCDTADVLAFHAGFAASPAPTSAPSPDAPLCRSRAAAPMGESCCTNQLMCDEIWIQTRTERGDEQVPAGGYYCATHFNGSSTCRAPVYDTEQRAWLNSQYCTNAACSTFPHTPGCHRCGAASTCFSFMNHYADAPKSEVCTDASYLPTIKFYPPPKAHGDHVRLGVPTHIALYTTARPFSMRVVAGTLDYVYSDSGYVDENSLNDILIVGSYFNGMQLPYTPIQITEVTAESDAQCTSKSRVRLYVAGYITSALARVVRGSSEYTELLANATDNALNATWIDNVRAIIIRVDVATGYHGNDIFSANESFVCTYTFKAAVSQDARAAGGNAQVFRDSFGNSYPAWTPSWPTTMKVRVQSSKVMCDSDDMDMPSDTTWQSVPDNEYDSSTVNACSASSRCCADFSNPFGATSTFGGTDYLLSFGGCYFDKNYDASNPQQCRPSLFTQRDAAPTPMPTQQPSATPSAAPTLMPTPPFVNATLLCFDSGGGGATTLCTTNASSACATCLVYCATGGIVDCADAGAVCNDGACVAVVDDAIASLTEWATDDEGIFYATFTLVLATVDGEVLQITELPTFGSLYALTNRRRRRRDARALLATAMVANDTITAENSGDAIVVWYTPSPDSSRNDADSVAYRIDVGNGFGPVVQRRVLGRDSAPVGAYESDAAFEQPATDTGVAIGIGIGAGICFLAVGGFALVYYFYLRPRALAAQGKSRGSGHRRTPAASIEMISLSPPTPHANYAAAPLSRGGNRVSPPTLPVGAAAVAARRPVDAKFHIDTTALVKGAKIGQGSFGNVYRGTWRGIDVAIKEVLDATDEEAVSSLLVEAEGLQSLRPHAHIVTLYGITHTPSFAIVTEFCERGSLDDMLYGATRRYPFSDAQIEHVVVSAAKGLCHLHHESVVHRDIAARNVLIDGNMNGKIADFGMSRRLRTSDSAMVSQQQTNQQTGPLKWMAPEQLDRRLYSKESDVWSFGVLIFEAIAREPPFKGLTNVRAASDVLGGKHLSAPTRTPPSVVVVLERCFLFDAATRPTMTWIVDALTHKTWQWPTAVDDVDNNVADNVDAIESAYSAPHKKRKGGKKHTKLDGYDRPPGHTVYEGVSSPLI